MKISICLSFLMFCIINMMGQTYTLTGKVVGEDKNPLIFATIALSSSIDSNSIKGEFSNEVGQFSFANISSGEFKMSISYLGYQKYDTILLIDKNISLPDIMLFLNNNSLDEVIIKGSHKIIERIEDKVVFNVSNSPMSQGYQSLEVLDRSPFINVDENGGISMRNQTAIVMINGRTLNITGDARTNYLRNINSEDIIKIEIQQNLSANINAESSGGVINIILRKRPKGWATDISSRYKEKSRGDFETRTGINLNYGSERWNTYGGYTHSSRSSLSDNFQVINYTENKRKLLEDGKWSNDNMGHNYQVGLVVDLSTNHELGLEGFGNSLVGDYANNNIVDYSQENEPLAMGKAAFLGTYDENASNASFNYRWRMDSLKSNLQIFGDYTLQKTIDNSTAESIYTLGNLTNNKERNNSSTKTRISGLQVDYDKTFKKGPKLEVGLKLTQTHRENLLLSAFFMENVWIPNDRSNDFDYDENVSAAYLSAGKKFNKHYVKIGLRTENTSLVRTDYTADTILTQDYLDLFPSVYYAFDIDDNTTISSSYSRRLRRPYFQFLNNYVIKVNDFRYELGNPDLRPEYVDNYGIDLRQQKQSFSIYYKKIHEAINGIYYLEGEATYYQKFNAGSQTQFGFTYDRFGYINKWWYLKGSAHVFNRKFTNEKGQNQFDQTTYYFNLKNIFTLSSSTNFEFNGRYRSRYEDAFYISLPRYLINVTLQHSFFDNQFIAKIYFNDIFNTLTYDNERPFDEFVSTQSYKPQSRNLMISLSYRISSSEKIKNRKAKSKNEASNRL